MFQHFKVNQVLSDTVQTVHEKAFALKFLEHNVFKALIAGRAHLNANHNPLNEKQMHCVSSNELQF